MNTVKRSLVSAVALISFVLLSERCSAQTPKRVLVVSVTEAYHHTCIETSKQVFVQLAVTSGDFTVDFADTSQDLTNKMSLSALNTYDAVVFNNTSGDLKLPSISAFLAWVASGRGFMAIHAGIAGATLPSHPAYADMLGGQTLTQDGVRTVTVFNQDPQNAATRGLAGSFQWTDEIWRFQNVHWSEIHELLRLNQHPTTGVPGDYPLAWCKAYGAGRVLVSALGHSADGWSNTTFQQHVLGGIRWMLKLDRGSLPLLVVESFRYPEGSFAFHYNGAAVETYSVQVSSNLVDWICVSTNTAVSNTTYRIMDADASLFPCRFYRVLLP